MEGQYGGTVWRDSMEGQFGRDSMEGQYDIDSARGTLSEDTLYGEPIESSDSTVSRHIRKVLSPEPDTRKSPNTVRHMTGPP